MKRHAQISRKTKETSISLQLNLDGTGRYQIKTPLPFFNHMLELFAFHGFFDLSLEVKKADLNVDIHHANEDVGIVLGQIFKKALAEKKGIRRFGSAFAPMEDTLGHCVVDISGRGHLKIGFVEMMTFLRPRPPIKEDEDGYSFKHLEHFLDSFAKNLGANIIVTIKNPSSSADLHTVMETVFKSLGLALDQATQIDPRRKGIPSTKGIID